MPAPRTYEFEKDGKTYEFDWDGPGDPTPDDIAQAFAGPEPMTAEASGAAHIPEDTDTGVLAGMKRGGSNLMHGLGGLVSAGADMMVQSSLPKVAWDVSQGQVPEALKRVGDLHGSLVDQNVAQQEQAAADAAKLDAGGPAPFISPGFRSVVSNALPGIGPFALSEADKIKARHDRGDTLGGIAEVATEVVGPEAVGVVARGVAPTVVDSARRGMVRTGLASTESGLGINAKINDIISTGNISKRQKLALQRTRKLGGDAAKEITSTPGVGQGSVLDNIDAAATESNTASDLALKAEGLAGKTADISEEVASLEAKAVRLEAGGDTAGAANLRRAIEVVKKNAPKRAQPYMTPAKAAEMRASGALNETDLTNVPVADLDNAKSLLQEAATESYKQEGGRGYGKAAQQTASSVRKGAEKGAPSTVPFNRRTNALITGKGLLQENMERAAQPILQPGRNGMVDIMQRLARRGVSPEMRVRIGRALYKAGGGADATMDLSPEAWDALWKAAEQGSAINRPGMAARPWAAPGDAYKAGPAVVAPASATAPPSPTTEAAPASGSGLKIDLSHQNVGGRVFPPTPAPMTPEAAAKQAALDALMKQGMTPRERAAKAKEISDKMKENADAAERMQYGTSPSIRSREAAFREVNGVGDANSPVITPDQSAVPTPREVVKYPDRAEAAKTMAAVPTEERPIPSTNPEETRLNFMRSLARQEAAARPQAHSGPVGVSATITDSQIKDALARSGGDASRAAGSLGISVDRLIDILAEAKQSGIK